MKVLTKLLWIPFTLSSLIGCSIAPYGGESRLCANNDGEFYKCNDAAAIHHKAQLDPTLFNTRLHFQLLSEYTEQMAADLQKDLAGFLIDEQIVVSSFVYFDTTLQETSALGNQLAEYFINDLQKIGLPVSDHKVTGMLVVNSEGDFSLSRKKDLVSPGIDIGYVLVGTMVENERGVVVNVRLVNYSTYKVVASTYKFLPTILTSG